MKKQQRREWLLHGSIVFSQLRLVTQKHAINDGEHYITMVDISSYTNIVRDI